MCVGGCQTQGQRPCGKAKSPERLKGHRDRDFTELEVRGKGHCRTVTVGIWRNWSKNGVGAEKKPVELGNQEAENGEVEGGVRGGGSEMEGGVDQVC